LGELVCFWKETRISLTRYQRFLQAARNFAIGPVGGKERMPAKKQKQKAEEKKPQ
jgi:hypothetical protein